MTREWRVMIGEASHNLWFEFLPFGNFEIKMDGHVIREGFRLPMNWTMNFEFRFKNCDFKIIRFGSWNGDHWNGNQKWGLSIDGALIADERGF